MLIVPTETCLKTRLIHNLFYRRVFSVVISDFTLERLETAQTFLGYTFVVFFYTFRLMLFIFHLDSLLIFKFHRKKIFPRKENNVSSDRQLALHALF